MAIRHPRLQDLTGLLNRLYPPALAESWDNVGLQVGDPQQEISRILIALDPSRAVIEQARHHLCQLVLTHHPLIFRPVKKITPQDATGHILFTAIQSGIAIFSAHTNLDSSANGLNDWLAARLGLEQTRPLQPPSSGSLLKLVVYVPASHQQQVADALFAAGAGTIGGYDRCSFYTAGTGTFRPGMAASPYVGTPGQDEQVDEIRLETVLPRHLQQRVLDRLFKSHPYEDVAFDLFALENQPTQHGLGRIGLLPRPLELEAFATQIKQQLGCTTLRQVQGHTKTLRKAAVCSGSGASVLHEAARQGADVLVTGDLKYHEALTAQELGLSVIDAGHFATEQIVTTGLQQVLQQSLAGTDWHIDILTAQQVQDPFTYI